MENIREVAEQGRMILAYDEKADLNLSEDQLVAAVDVLKKWALIAELNPDKAYAIWETAESDTEFESQILRKAIRFRLQKEDEMDDGMVIATILGIQKPLDTSFRSLLGCFEDHRYSFETTEVSFDEPFEKFLWDTSLSFFRPHPEWLFLLLWILQDRPMVITQKLKTLVGGCPFLTIRNDTLIFMPASFFSSVDLKLLHFSEGDMEQYSASFFHDLVGTFVLDNGCLAVEVQESKPFLALHWGKGSK